MMAFLPVSVRHWALTASSAVLRLAAANTTTSPPCALAGSPCEPHVASSTAAAAAALRLRHVRLEIAMLVFLASARADERPDRHKITIPRYIPMNIAQAIAAAPFSHSHVSRQFALTVTE